MLAELLGSIPGINEGKENEMPPRGSTKTRSTSHLHKVPDTPDDTAAKDQEFSEGAVVVMSDDDAALEINRLRDYAREWITTDSAADGFYVRWLTEMQSAKEQGAHRALYRGNAYDDFGKWALGVLSDPEGSDNLPALMTDRPKIWNPSKRRQVVHDFRTRLGISQADTAKLLGFTEMMVSRDMRAHAAAEAIDRIPLHEPEDDSDGESPKADLRMKAGPDGTLRVEPEMPKVRAWAQHNQISDNDGKPVMSRGRIPEEVIEQYIDAGYPEVETPTPTRQSTTSQETSGTTAPSSPASDSLPKSWAASKRAVQHALQGMETLAIGDVKKISEAAKLTERWARAFVTMEEDEKSGTPSS